MVRHLSVKGVNRSGTAHRTGTSTFGLTGEGAIFQNTLLLFWTFELIVTLDQSSVWTHTSLVTGLFREEHLRTEDRWVTEPAYAHMCIHISSVSAGAAQRRCSVGVLPLLSHSTAHPPHSRTLPKAHTCRCSAQSYRYTHRLLHRAHPRHSCQVEQGRRRWAGKAGRMSHSDCLDHKVELQESTGRHFS